MASLPATDNQPNKSRADAGTAPARSPRTRRWMRGERGAVAVEFALVLPVLVLLLFGIIEFGRGYNAQISLQGAVREGARTLAIGNGDPAAAVRSAAPSLSGIAVTTSGSPCTAGTTASVTATYPFTYNVPLFGTATKTLTATGVMRCGG